MTRTTFSLLAPFAAWIALMTLLPSTAWAYAVRTGVTVGLLAFGARDWFRRTDYSWVSLVWGLVVGFVVLVLWIAPEHLSFYRRFCILGEGGTEAIAESDPLLIAVRLLGSAFVISVAEELFFRKWLIGFAGFPWMVVLFAIEHDRWLAGAVAGVLYGLVYLRKGFGAATIAHATTNLFLGLWVILTGDWALW